MASKCKRLSVAMKCGAAARRELPHRAVYARSPSLAAPATWRGKFHLAPDTLERGPLPPPGRIAVGNAADLVLFDPKTVADRSTWQAPRLPPVGVEEVMVNGEWVIRHGNATDKLPGRVLQSSY